MLYPCARYGNNLHRLLTLPRSAKDAQMTGAARFVIAFQIAEVRDGVCMDGVLGCS